MRMHYLIRRIAGMFVLISLALGYWVNPWFYVFTAFVGLNLIQSSFSHFCPMESLLAALGVPGERRP
jgi:Inner membrane protein YgaP-like, transmembrane domain